MSQNGTRTIDPVVMYNASQTVGSQCSTIENLLNNIVRDAASLISVWEGESANAYQAAINKIAENSPNVVSIFRKYSQNLNEIATNHLSIEEILASMNESLPDNILSE